MTTITKADQIIDLTDLSKVPANVEVFPGQTLLLIEADAASNPTPAKFHFHGTDALNDKRFFQSVDRKTDGLVPTAFHTLLLVEVVRQGKGEIIVTYN